MWKCRAVVWRVLVGCAVFFFLGATGLSYADTKDGKPKVRFGIQTPPEIGDPADLIKLWQEAEEWGFDTAWTFDHFMPISGNPLSLIHI